MSSLSDKAKIVRDALNNVPGLKSYHFHKPADVNAPYAVWQEDSEDNSFHANNRKAEQVLQLTIDYFTLTEYDDTADKIQEALNNAEVAWKLNSFQYEDDTKLSHYEWLVKVI